MKKWIHKKTGVIRYADLKEKTALGHGFIPFEEAKLVEIPKKESHEPKQPDLVKNEKPKEPTKTATPRKRTRRKKVD